MATPSKKRHGLSLDSKIELIRASDTGKSQRRLAENMDDLTLIPTAHCPKVFIQRDYSNGTPVERSVFDYTMSNLNSLYEEAEKLSGRTYCEGCCACLTAYLIYLCMDTHYEKMLKKISRFIREQNETVYIPRGLLLIDPSERGLRIVSFLCHKR
ncbi:hypothetical protein LSH36_74g02001 [Paralvinella palmiformis]|uniref:Ras modification protein ERF4 n=1 Tax=Paralvinella palmiformis TaxID=53620 RepID=A0AAD9NCQ5_9ANNE|nr:hypothetical protein LSH36_74g02001 [Paralvinella palmiformis]